MFEKYSKLIDELLAKMTLREKIGQLNQPETPTAENAEQVKEQVRRGEIGSILMSVGATAGNTAQGSISVDFYNELQRIAVEESRCGIPLIFGRDVIHGHRTVCPVPLAQAAAFDHPYCTPKTVDRSEHLKNARRLARESMVLLKNEKGLLPLDKSDSIALLGPFVHERRSLLGSWTIDGKAEETPTLYEAMKAAGVSPLISSDPSGLYDDNPFIMESAQVLVLALGESWLTTGENHSSSEITISAAQKRLIADAKASGKKTVGVFFCGRPIALEGIADQLDAVLYAWHGGSEVAGAVCDLLFGEYSPGGRLPVTMPRRSTHIPLCYNCLPSGRPVNGYYGEFPESNYTDSIALPCYPFGYGLSYTTFDYSAIGCKNNRLTIGELEKGDGFELSVDVTNSGGFDSYETVQLYIRDVCARMMRPLRELKGFEKVFIRQGERKTVTFKPGKAELGYFMPDGSFVLEKGRFEIYIGENCLTKNKTEIEII